MPHTLSMPHAALRGEDTEGECLPGVVRTGNMEKIRFHVQGGTDDGQVTQHGGSEKIHPRTVIQKVCCKTMPERVRRGPQIQPGDFQIFFQHASDTASCNATPVLIKKQRGIEAGWLFR